MQPTPDDIDLGNMLERAIAIAVRAHAGQRDKAGAPYILHPIRVMMRLDAVGDRIVAILHDVMEDGPPDAAAEARDLLHPRLLDALIAVTKRADERGPEGYDRFIARAMGDRIARRVKIADLKDNLDITRLDTLSGKDAERLARYMKSLRRLREHEAEEKS